MVSITQTNTDARIVTDNNKSTCMKKNEKKIIHNILYQATTLDINRQSSSCIATKKLTTLLQPIDEFVKISSVDSHHESSNPQ